MDERAANYVFAGAGGEDTMDANREAFRRRRIVPRMLRDVVARDLSTTVLGTSMPAPLMLAPIGVQKVVHADGELATARAAASLGVPMIASTASHFSLEEIAEAGGEAPRWFQLYWPNDRELGASFVSRAEAAGYGAIVAHRRHLRPRLEAARPAAGLAALPRTAWASPTTSRTRSSAPAWSRRRRRTSVPPPATSSASAANPSLDWDDLDWLREQTSLPIVVKGIQHPDDAREAARAASTASSSPTTAAARSTARSARSTPCRRSPRRSATSWRSSSTAASAAAAT